MPMKKMMMIIQQLFTRLTQPSRRAQTSPCLIVRKGTRHESSDDQDGDDDDDVGEIQNDFNDEYDRYIMIMTKMAIKPR